VQNQTLSAPVKLPNSRKEREALALQKQQEREAELQKVSSTIIIPYNFVKLEDMQQ
jgi:hypothetical protein